MITPEAMREKLIEAMARAIYSAEGFVHNSDDRMFEPVKWEEADADEYQCIRDGYRQKADAALTAIEAQGLAVCPVDFPETKFDEDDEPTDIFQKTWAEAYKESVAKYGKPAFASYTFFSKLWRPMITVGKL